MKEQEAREVVTQWAKAVHHLWTDIAETAKRGKVMVPQKSFDLGGVSLAITLRGIEVMIGSTGYSFERLLDEPAFDLTLFPKIREGVIKAIDDARQEVAQEIQKRNNSWATSFGDLKKDIAEWELTRPYDDTKRRMP